MEGYKLHEVADVVRLFQDVAAIFRQHGNPKPGHLTTRVIDAFEFHDIAFSSAGPHQFIQGPDLLVFHRPGRREGFGWMRRIDVRRGSPTAMVTLLKHLNGKGLT